MQTRRRGRSALPFRDPFSLAWRLQRGQGHPNVETITSEQPTVPPTDEMPDMDEPVVPRRSPLRAAIKTGRPQEWIKNLFVFAGLLFSGKFDQSHAVLEAVLTFVSFCLISSAGYYLNDLLDVELDRKHPKKRFRPLAAGELSEGAAKTI